MKIAILIPAADYRIDWRWAYDEEAGALAADGLDVVAVRWTDERDLGEFDLVVPLVAWGYHRDYPAWLRFLDRLELQRLPVCNPVGLLRWNGDKAYLAKLGAAGIPTVPTLVVDSLDQPALEAARDTFGCDRFVIKPPVSASAFGTFVIHCREQLPQSVIGLRMMVQPWLGSIEREGEYSLIFFDGEFSHSVSKRPRPGEFRVQSEYGGTIARCEPPPGSVALARSALKAAPAPSGYARVDLVAANDGGLKLIELELIEPALFLAEAPEARARLARAVRSAAQRLRE